MARPRISDLLALICSTGSFAATALPSSTMSSAALLTPAGAVFTIAPVCV
jgi:hypothetical protein